MESAAGKNNREDMPAGVKRLVENVEKSMEGGRSLKEAVDPANLTAQMRKQRVADLIAGKVEPPNEFASYLIAQLRETMSAGKIMAQQIKTTRVQLEQMEQEALRMEGGAEQHLRDLEKWDKPLASETPPVEDSAPKEESDETSSGQTAS